MTASPIHDTPEAGRRLQPRPEAREEMRELAGVSRREDCGECGERAGERERAKAGARRHSALGQPRGETHRQREAEEHRGPAWAFEPRRLREQRRTDRSERDCREGQARLMEAGGDECDSERQHDGKPAEGVHEPGAAGIGRQRVERGAPWPEDRQGDDGRSQRHDGRRQARQEASC